MPDPISTATQFLPDKPTASEDKLRTAAINLEASFLAEMLKAAKFGEPRDSFGGGAGEEQFSSFFRAEIAKEMAASGGIGLAENLFEALKARQVGD